jgi:TonB family protein
VAALLIPAVNFVYGQAIPSVGRTVCGKVEKITCENKHHFFTTLELKPKSKDSPVTILSADRSHFTPAPEELYRDTDVCVTGRVDDYAGHRRLIVSGPQDITIRKRLKAPEAPWSSPHFYDCDEGIVIPVLTIDVQPNYTPAAMKARIQGTVALEGIVGIDGRVSELRVQKSLDSKLGLDQEAMTAIHKWQFKPATRFGVPVPFRADFQMSFTLK